MDETRKAKIIAEIKSTLPELYNPETDISAIEAAEIFDCDPKTAIGKMRELVKQGKVIEVENVKLPNRKVGRVWRPVESNQE